MPSPRFKPLAGPRPCSKHGARLPRHRTAFRGSPIASLVSGLLAALGLTSEPRTALAESALLFPEPETLSRIAATTFDLDGIAVGESAFWVEPGPGGQLTMKLELAIEGGGINRSQATFVRAPAESSNASAGLFEAERGAETALPGDRLAAPNAPDTAPDTAPETPRLRLIEQRARSTRADGVTLPLLIVDHVQQRATCIPNGPGKGRRQSVALPEQDRVVNVPLQMLFEPLVAGKKESVAFQLALCRKGPVVYDMLARRGTRSRSSARDILEIEYGPDVGQSMGWLARRVLPRFAFWFDAERGSYLAHQMPLHTQGPEVLLVRQGIQPSDLGLLSD